MAETIFYITGSIFFALAIAMLAIFIYYIFKILQTIVGIEKEVKNAVTEVKIKIATFSIGFTSIIALLEKFVEFRNRHSQDKTSSESSDPKSQEEEEVKAKKIRIKRIFCKGE